MDFKDFTLNNFNHYAMETYVCLICGETPTITYNCNVSIVITLQKPQPDWMDGHINQGRLQLQHQVNPLFKV